MSEATLMTDAATTTEGTASQPADAGAAQTSAAPAAATEQQASTAQTTQNAANTAEGNGNQGDAGNTQDTKPEVPEKYDFKLPDDVKVDPAGMQAFSEFAKEAGLSQEAAQGLISKLAPAMQARQAEAIQQLRTSWEDASKSDKEFGGDKLAENLSVAQKAMTTFGTPELRTLLNETGLGNHPEIIRAFVRAGKAISEDRFVPSTGGAAGQSRDAAKSLYPNQ
jgi:hypothetical protein